MKFLPKSIATAQNAASVGIALLILGIPTGLLAADTHGTAPSRRPLAIYLVRPDFPDQMAMMSFLKQRITESLIARLI
jgi:hypothetical protein